MQRRHRLLFCLAALVGASCAAAPSQAPASNGSSAADAPSDAPDSAPASVHESSTAAELEVTGAPLAPGRYTRTGFVPPVSFELNGDWEAVQDANGFFDVQQRIGTPDVIAVQFANVLQVYGDGGAVTPDGHADAARIVATNPDVTVLGSSEAHIGGLTGSVVEVENGSEAHVSVLQVPPGALGIDPGRRLWIAFVDSDAGLVAIMVGGSAAEWQAALDAAEPVLESVRIGSG